LTTDVAAGGSDKADQRPSITVAVLSESPLACVVQIQVSFPGRRSFLQQHVTLTALSPTATFHTAVLWRETHAMLRVGFPVSSTASQAEYDCAWGSVSRPLHSSTPEAEMQQEVAGHSYACVVQENLAVALFSDCKYGYNCMPGVMRLSLLRSSQAPDKHADCATHVFKYGLTVATPGIRALTAQVWVAVCALAQCPVPRAATACGTGSLRDMVVAEAKRFNCAPFESSVSTSTHGAAVSPFELFAVVPSAKHAMSCCSVVLDGVKMCETPLQSTFTCSALAPAKGLFEAAAPLHVPVFILRLYESTGQSGWCTVHSSTPLSSALAVNLLEQPFGAKGDVSYSGYEEGATHDSVAAAARRVGDAASGMQHRGPMPPVVALQKDGTTMHVFVSGHQIVSIKCVPVLSES
jgi:alpha-mannosidase